VTYSPGQVKTGVELLALESLEALNTKLETGRHKTAMWPLAKSVVDNRLVLINRHRASRVHDVATSCRVGITRVKSAQDELLLEMGKELEVTFRLQELALQTVGSDNIPC
jgi:hypothetical protein